MPRRASHGGGATANRSEPTAKARAGRAQSSTDSRPFPTSAASTWSRCCPRSTSSAEPLQRRRDGAFSAELRQRWSDSTFSSKSLRAAAGRAEQRLQWAARLQHGPSSFQLARLKLPATGSVAQSLRCRAFHRAGSAAPAQPAKLHAFCTREGPVCHSIGYRSRACGAFWPPLLSSIYQ